MAHSKIVMKFIVAIVLLATQLPKTSSTTNPQPWIKSGYWLTVSGFPYPALDSSLFTHLIYGFANINSTTFHLSIPSSDHHYFSTFTSNLKLKNPTIKTLLSIGDSRISSTFFSMISTPSSRTAFINSSIETAIRYDFDGLDLCYIQPPNSTQDSLNMATLFHEWRLVVNSKVFGNSNDFLLTMGLSNLGNNNHSNNNEILYPVGSIQNNFNWVHLMSFDYFVPLRNKIVHPQAALYDPDHNHMSTDDWIQQLNRKGLSMNKILMGLPYHGWAWRTTAKNSNENEIVGGSSLGPGATSDGSMGYKNIKVFAQSSKTQIVYNSSYVENFCSIGDIWVGFDDVDAIKTKVSYAMEKGLAGYNVFQLSNDDNGQLSRIAAHMNGDNDNHVNMKMQLLIKVLVPVALISCLGIVLLLYKQKIISLTSGLIPNPKNLAKDSADLKAFKFVDIAKATNNFSLYNKLGQGGYGPVYKGKLRKGQEIAVKRLSKASRQGFEEFKNEVMLTGRLQHVNLVKIMGFCMEREEKMLIYEYLPNKSLDFYLFDPSKSLELDWEKRAQIIEGVVQGLLYLQEYSRLTVIHRDLKASNILLDKELCPKISDFGLARVFQKDEYEANTSRIVGTYGYVPPEYVKQGVYSAKYDVYSFGVLMLQIISSKSNRYLYGTEENLNLLEYAYELWVQGRDMEFVDPRLDDSLSKHKVKRCMHIAMLCVQEHQEDRPSMLEIQSMLVIGNEIVHPKRPAFSTKKPIEPKQSSCIQITCSNNNTSIVSELEPR